MNIQSVSINSLFQPLYSIRENKFTAVEALSRGSLEKQNLSAGQLFSLPENDREMVDLNMKCIEEAFCEFKRQGADEDCSIFINFDSSLLDCSFLNWKLILEMAERFEIKPSCIVIELIESRVKSMETFMAFTDFFRSHGVLIALDDVGSGYSSLDRIARIQPDIIKIDRSLVSGISSEFYKREICRSLVQLSHNIGALSLAEGVETLDDALVCLGIGSDIIQGFFFSRPEADISINEIPGDRVEALVNSWKTFSGVHNEKLGHNLNRIRECASLISQRLIDVDSYLWNTILGGYVEQYHEVQCAYILDGKGSQISDTCMKSGIEQKTHKMFCPARSGTDHSFKPYFSKRQVNQNWFVSDPYISRATGQMCRTVNMQFFDRTQSEYLICLDMKC